MEEQGDDVDETVDGKLLVSNQVLVTARMEGLRKRAIVELDLNEDTFRHEPTVFAPKLTAVIKNIDICSVVHGLCPHISAININGWLSY